MQTILSAPTRTLAAAPKAFRGLADRIACVTHGSLPRCSLGVLRESKSMSASTIIRTSS